MIYGNPAILIDDDHTDRIGIRTLVLSQLWQPVAPVVTIEDLDAQEPAPPEVPGGVWFIGRQRRRQGGALRTSWTFEGINGSGKDVTFKGRGNSPDYGFESGFAQVSLALSPRWPTFRDTYGAYQLDGQIIIPDTLPQAQSSGPIKPDSSTAVKNPLFGQETFLRMEGTYKYRYASFGVPDESGVGYITAALPGQPPVVGDDRTWLRAPTVWDRRGPVIDTTEVYWLSGPGGWPTPIFGR